MKLHDFAGRQSRSGFGAAEIAKSQFAISRSQANFIGMLEGQNAVLHRQHRSANLL
jgi:hypothetical protein